MCLTQGHGLSGLLATGAHLFAQVRTFRISQFSGVTSSTGSIDLAAHAGAILPIALQIFIRFRELYQRVGTRCFSSSIQFRTTTNERSGSVALIMRNRLPSGEMS